jgi:outer membrane protein TolC
MIRKIILGSSLILVFLAGISPALTLKESINLALKNNPSIIASQKKLDAANAKMGQAIGAFLPTIKVDGNIGRYYSQPSVVQMTITTAQGSVTQRNSFGPDMVADTKSITTSLSQPIFMAALFPGYKIAKKGADLAREDLNKAALETSFNATQAYFSVLKAEKLVKLSEQSREMAESHLKQVKAMLSAGVATQADLLRIEVQLANSEVSLTRAKNALEIAKDAFNNALGRDLEQDVQLVEEGFNGGVLNLPEYKDLLKMSFDYRPDWKQYILSKQIGEENVRIAATAYFPTVMLSGQTGNQIVEYPSYKTDINSWSITGIASWTLFDGFGIQNRICEATANLDAQKANEEQIKNGIALEVRDAYLNLKSARETIGSAKKAVESAEENHKVSALRFSSGVGTNLEVLDAQVSLTQAGINYLQTLFDVEIAKAKINKVIGREVI